MKSVCLAAYVCLAALAAPQWTAAGLVGNYRTSTGFEIWGLELRKDATASYRYSPDHPGGRTFDGTWSFDGEVVTLRLTSIKGKRKTGHVWKFVPVTWGERQYLVCEEEIRDFAGTALQWKDSNLDPRSQESEMHRAPLMRFADRNYKRRYGNPKAPGKFASWFDWC